MCILTNLNLKITSLDVWRPVHLALCWQHSAKTDLPLSASYRAEPTPNWGWGHQHRRGVSALSDITKGQLPERHAGNRDWGQ